ncbi:rho guanine nucleotide exchange factor 26 [Caerostris extrusa]|uniref:Rho guanine nucleotide exchange factor 26 n=1 Tax=Caerostris extrusa TaxID=172846 RepID=A0AAV4V511_CAEEX|nr:rho guanine nucleotide exchange factor 26 [Caerostris extrusa]
MQRVWPSPPSTLHLLRLPAFHLQLLPGTKQPSETEESEDSLYYNVCCLDSPNRESWRQSRRRPVCEQNGRLCIVNCDMEKCTSNCNNTEKPSEYYSNLSECHSSPPLPAKKDSSKQLSENFEDACRTCLNVPWSWDDQSYEEYTQVCPQYSKNKRAWRDSRESEDDRDSCDSDEGWVDITDSEDEKFSLAGKRNVGTNCESIYGNTLPPNIMQMQYMILIALL